MMRKKLHGLTALVAFASLASMSTASFAADNSASWAALSAATTSSDQGACSSRADGPCQPFAAWAPLGVIVAAVILAIILASKKGHGRGPGFPGPGVSPS